MKDRRRREVVSISWSRFFCFTLFVVFTFILFTGFTSFRLFGETFHPVLISSWGNSVMDAISEDSITSSSIEIRETVIFPDQFVIFLYYPLSSSLFSKDDLHCSYFHPNSTQPELKLPPVWIDKNQNSNHQIIRCPISSTGVITSLSLNSKGHLPRTPTPHSWDFLVYEAMLDRDNTTIIFVKGLNLRPDRLADSLRYECVYGWDFEKPRLLLTSEVISAAQEIVRCKTPMSVLIGLNKSIKVSVEVKRRGIIHSVARLDYRLESDSRYQKKYEMCVCTMVRNQARFIREWVMYHAQLGVQRWFIYDNNSEDAIDEVIESLYGTGYSITRHVWPWLKTQEAGFAHCALRARESCEWVGFFDVDEFLHFPSGISLQNVVRNQTVGFDQVGELRISCHSFGPSGLKKVPAQGVSVGYTCRLANPERHKSIVRPEVLNSSLINVVHHFHVREGVDYINVDKTLMVINHYKYQVWDVFKEKFNRRVATYVVDWRSEQNVGSKDRVPGLGTRAVEPSNWSSSFCEVTDTGLRSYVLKMFTNHHTERLPWEEDDA